MDYYRLLKLEREPFSNSPDPDLFFRSRQHRKCLQALEISLRLKRGLNVVCGAVGTGKTTICRQLVRALGEDPGIESHLILDPTYESSSAFLKAAGAMLIGSDADLSGKTDSQVRELLKQALFAKGVEDGKTIILIIDEGQKIPLYCLELLRELLNYETNEHKLLQIVIFAQREFEDVLKTYENFTDRINLKFQLGPLNFSDTRKMIRYRVAKSASLKEKTRLFSFSGLLAVYLHTGGYPRKIINLCHKITLAMIIKDSRMADWILVRSVVKGSMHRRALGRFLLPPILIALALAGLYAYTALDRGGLNAPGQTASTARKDGGGALEYYIIQPDPENKAASPALAGGPEAGIRSAEGDFETGAEAPVQEPAPETRKDPAVQKAGMPEIPAGRTSQISHGVEEPGPVDEVSAEAQKPEVQTDLAGHRPGKPEAADVPSAPALDQAAEIIKENDAEALEPAVEIPAMASAETEVIARSEDEDTRILHEDPGPDDSESMAEPFVPVRIPRFLGSVTVDRHETLGDMVHALYGTYKKRYIDAVLDVNYGKMTSPDNVPADIKIRFPVLPETLDLYNTGYISAELGVKKSLDAAFKFRQGFSSKGVETRILPFWSRKDKGIRFSVMVNEFFLDQQAARARLEEISSKEGRVRLWDDHTVFLTEPPY